MLCIWVLSTCVIPAPQDVSAESSLKSPDLYRLGPLNQLFNPLTIAAMLAQTLFSSLVLFFIPYGVFHDSPLDYQTMAVTISMADIFCVDAEVSPGVWWVVQWWIES